jgi:hypothetical protein
MILIDSHVHIYDIDSIGDVLSTALSNFTRLTDRFALETSKTAYVLGLTESSGVDNFSKLWAQKGSPLGNIWRLRSAHDEETLIAEHPHGRLFLIAGRQVVCREKIEILALGTREHIRDGAPIEETLPMVKSAKALTVLPWGFGKWLGARGKVVQDLVKRQDRRESIFMGDICGRPKFPGRHKLFQKAVANGIRVLAGTDPLPIPAGYAKVGRYGTAIDTKVDVSISSARLKALLTDSGTSLRTVGKRQPLLSILREQILLRIYGQLRPHDAPAS